MRNELGAWQSMQKEGGSWGALLRTGFVDDDVHAGFIGNAFELQVRLSHMLERMDVLVELAQTSQLKAEPGVVEQVAFRAYRPCP